MGTIASILFAIGAFAAVFLQVSVFSLSVVYDTLVPALPVLFAVIAAVLGKNELRVSHYVVIMASFIVWDILTANDSMSILLIALVVVPVQYILQGIVIRRRAHQFLQFGIVSATTAASAVILLILNRDAVALTSLILIVTFQVIVTTLILFASLRLTRSAYA